MAATFDLNHFISLFPGASTHKDGTAIEYTVQDSTYRIYNPDVSNDGTSLTLDVKLDHVRGGATDDHVGLSLVFDSSAILQSVTYTWEAGNDGYTIPKTVVVAVDAGIEALGGAGAVETAGVSVVVAQAAVVIFDTCALVYNQISKKMVAWTDNGGRFYFLPVVGHCINRLGSSVSA
jgi:hypothetical protein